MRKILFFLLLLPSVAFSQITISRDGTLCCYTGGIGSIGGITFSAGNLYIIYVGISNTGSTEATVSLSGTGQTWTEIGSAGGIHNGSSFRRLQAFRFAPTSTNTNTVTFTLGGSGNQDGMWFELIIITGADIGGTNGSNAIVQYTSSSANGADPSLTFGSAITGGNSVIAGFINSVVPFTGTPESGWTELHDDGYSVPDTGDYMIYRINTTDNTPTVTAASGNWAGLAIEIKSAFRRIIITN